MSERQAKQKRKTALPRCHRCGAAGADNEALSANNRIVNLCRGCLEAVIKAHEEKKR